MSLLSHLIETSEQSTDPDTRRDKIIRMEQIVCSRPFLSSLPGNGGKPGHPSPRSTAARPVPASIPGSTDALPVSASVPGWTDIPPVPATTSAPVPERVDTACSPKGPRPGQHHHLQPCTDHPYLPLVKLSLSLLYCSECGTGGRVVIHQSPSCWLDLRHLQTYVEVSLSMSLNSNLVVPGECCSSSSCSSSSCFGAEVGRSSTHFPSLFLLPVQSPTRQTSLLFLVPVLFLAWLMSVLFLGWTTPCLFLHQF
ncbi:hypothetical protein EXN66_Car007101 [Channa argus]|uniref:Uncharacterized protein n=1 Tax=Channa argus TaxID=215402 RepID=A0A6G1PN50_CHAAH|nr:hypothetical protein EXN66_Car007101 [Channa argus]